MCCSLDTHTATECIRRFVLLIDLKVATWFKAAQRDLMLTTSGTDYLSGGI
jgi:hypothetical protein